MKDRGGSRAWRLGVPAAVAGAALAFDPSAASTATPKVALSLLVALAVLTLSLPRLWQERTSPPIGVALWLALAGWSLVALAWSSRPDPTVPALWLAAGGIALCVGLADPAERRFIAGRSALLVTSGASLVAVAQYASGAEGIARHGAMGNPNWLGLTLACALPLVLGHASRCRGLERHATFVALALGAVGLVLAQSRVAFVALVVVGVGFATRRLRARQRASVIAVALAALAVVSILGWSKPLTGRLWLSSVSLEAWADAPLVGDGSGAFTSAFLTAQGEQLRTLPIEDAARRFLFATSAHGDWLQLAVEGGAIALCLGLLLFIAAITTAKPSAVSCLVVVAVCMIGDAPLRQPAVVLLVALALTDTRSLPQRSDRRDPLLAGAVAIALACSLPRAGTQWLAERAADAARDAEPAERITALERARRMAPWWSEAALDAGIAWLDLGEHERALDAFEEAAAGGMVGPTLHVARGNAFVRAGRPREAIASYEAALDLHPASFRAHANLAEAARLGGDVALAERHLRLARELMPHHPKLAAIADRLRERAIDEATSAAHDEAGQSR